MPLAVVPPYSTILCVDDEAMALAVRAKVLEAAGYVVITASTASEALRLFKSDHIDLVITDHLLPGTTGNDLAQELRKISPTLPIVSLPGDQIPSDMQPPDFYLHKLDGPAEMIARVQSIIGMHT